MSDVLYRKHRPQEFTHVMGQDHIVSVLTKQSQTNAPAHAYLFVGGRGLGKTSLARIFARALSIAPEDIYEIDGASYRKLDDAKDLKETISTLPVSSQYKMYIIDEAHMLTKEAWNSLLKTIEEPPKHVIFVFATTEKHKVLPTIISRCVVFDFKTPDIGEIKKLVNKVSELESLKLDDNQITKIAYEAKGSFRDSLSILQSYVHRDSQSINSPSITQDVCELLTNISNGTTTHTIISKTDIGSLEYLFETAIAIATKVLLTRFVKNYSDTEGITVEKSIIDELVKQKSINSQFLISLIELSEKLYNTSHKKEYIYAWLMTYATVEN